MTDSRSPSSPGRGLMVGAVFTVLILGSAWISGVFDPITTPAGTVVGSEQGAPATAPINGVNVPPPAPPPEPPPPAQRAAKPALARAAIWHDVTARTAGATRGPLVIGLHGRGDSAQNFARLAPRFPAAISWRFLQASAAFSSGFAWFLRGAGGRPEGISDGVTAIHTQVLAAGSDRPVALFGFSQGCMMILHYLVAHPDHVRAAACVGGSVVGVLATEVGGESRPPILFVNGAEDPVVPAQDTRAAMQRVEALGFPTEHIEHAGGHTVPVGEIDRIGTWLLTKLRQP
jgi:predicted esterase